ncbi:MAG: hypothetical protein ACE144_02100 [Thermodesulfobacteriota bacterium]
MPLLIFLLTLLSSIPCSSQALIESSDQIWEVGDRRWAVEEEYRFGRWVDGNIEENFFIRHRIPTDCADAVYAIRWIYARINHLPAAATTKDGRLVGHWSAEWKHLPTDVEWHKDERFRAALLYLFPNTWTGTLPNDTYPVRIAPDSVTPGTLFLVTESHTGIIGHVFFDGSQAHPLQTWESALPVKVQKLSLRYLFSARPEFKTRSGLVKFRWPVSGDGGWTYLPVQDHPFYSEEQYASNFCEGYADFPEAVARKIDPKTYPPMEKTVKILGTITQFLKERVPVVRTGYQECRNGGCPQGSEMWEIHSTQGRDGMIALMMDHLSQILEQNPMEKGGVKKMMEAIPIDISENRSLTLDDLYQNHLWFSPHPEDSIEARWGLKKCEMIREEIRAIHSSIAFIQKAYRKRDPKYADFSIRQQEQLLTRLREESTRSECRESPPVPKTTIRLPDRPSPKTPIKPRPISKACMKIDREIRATYDSMAFIEKTYREKDPAYADFSIRQQQHILGRLIEERAQSDCKEPPSPLRKEKPTPKGNRK